MLIKAVTRQGNPVPYSPEEALPYAVEYGVKSMNTQERVYWVLKNTVQKDSIHYNNLPDGGWEAVAEGSASIGHTVTSTDAFMDAKNTKFKIHYKPGKDELGLPDIKIVSFETLTD